MKRMIALPPALKLWRTSLGLARLGGLILALSAMAAADPVWVQDGCGFSGNYRDIQMLDDSTGWAVCDNGLVYKRTSRLYPQTSDFVWIAQSDVMPGGTQYGYDFRGVCFADANNGWIVGYSNGGLKKYMGVVLRTEDGGLNWSAQYSINIPLLAGTPDSLTPFLKVKVAKPGLYYRGYISCGNGYVLKLQDNGTWLPIRPPAPNNDSISVWYNDLWLNANDPNQVWVLGDNSCLFAGSTDGGTQWNFEYPSEFSQGYAFPPNTNTPLGTKLANLSLYGNGYNDVYYGMSYGAVAHYSGGWSSLSNIGNGNWIYDVDAGPDGAMFTCGNNSIWRLQSGEVFNEHTIPFVNASRTFNAVDFTPSQNHGYASGYVQIRHRYESAGITDFTVTRNGNYLTAQWQSTEENNLRKWQVCHHGVVAQDAGSHTADSLVPCGAGTTYALPVFSWAPGTPGQDSIRDIYITVRATANDGSVVNFGPVRATEATNGGMGLPVSIISAADVPDDNGHKIKIEWRPATPGSLTVILRSQKPTGPWQIVSAAGSTGGPCSTFVDVSGLLNDVNYYYTIQYLKNGISYSQPSAAQYAMAKDGIAPDRPAAPAGSYNHATQVMTLNWSPVNDPDLGGYWVCPEPVGVFSDDPPAKYTLSHTSPITRTSWKWRVPDSYPPNTLVFSVAAMDRSGNVSPWSDPVYINTKVLTNSCSPSATAFNNGRHLLYDGAGHLNLVYTSNDSVIFQKSWDNGYSWTPGVKFASGGANPAPALGFDGNDTNIVWKAETELSGWVLTGANKNGAAWGAPFVIDEQPGGYDQAYAVSPPSICMNAAGTHLAIERRDVHYTPGGQSGTWSWALRYGFCPKGSTTCTWTDLDTASGSWIHIPPDEAFASPTICLDASGGIHVAWDADGEVWWMMRDAGGQWLAKRNLTNSPAAASREPSLSLCGDVHLVWQEGNDVFHAKGNYGMAPAKGAPQLGFNWSTAENVSNSPATASFNPVFDGGFAAWSEETKPGQHNAYIAWYDGINWDAPRDFSKNPTHPSMHPQIACRQADGASKMTTVWTEGTGPLYSLIARDETGQVTPVFAADLGGENPSIYTLQRDGYLTYTHNGNPIAVDYDSTELQYYLPTLDPAQEQNVAIGFFEPASKGNKVQYKVYVDDVPLGVVNLNPGEYVNFEKKIPGSVCHDGEGVLRIEKKKGAIVTCDWFRLYVGDKGSSKGGTQFTEGATNPIVYRYELAQNAPNPCNGKTTIRYQLASPGRTTLRIYNTLGQAVKTLVDGDQPAGIYNVNWDGKDCQDRRAAAGVYVYRLHAGGYSNTKKMVVLQ